jgi:hypothetical protein
MATPWPKDNLAGLIFERLDLSTFRNSTGPRRQAGQRLFGDLGIHASKVSDTEATYISDSFSYTVQVPGRRDYNRDGVEDVAICFSGSATQASYRTNAPYLVQLINGRVMALAFEIDSSPEAKDCQRVPGAAR